jgi:Ser-tRNA(Ala) deacylase AlaX
LTHQAHLQQIASDDRGQYCVLDSTVFYPQGGGQPSDTGFVEIKGVQILISFVGFMDGEVHHYGDFSSISVEQGEQVTLHVDEVNRLQNAKAHTSGHILANVVEEIEKGLTAVKGHHFPNGSYVEFQGSLTSESTDEFIAKVNTRLRKMLDTGSDITIKLVMLNEIKERCSHLPSNLPVDNPLRIMTIGDSTPTPCGGTHLKSLKELKEVKVTKAKRQQGNLKVSYSFE